MVLVRSAALDTRLCLDALCKMTMPARHAPHCPFVPTPGFPPRRCDQIIVLENGRVAESGSHFELLARGGRYAELWAKQAHVDDLDSLEGGGGKAAQGSGGAGAGSNGGTGAGTNGHGEGEGASLGERIA